MDSRQKSIVDAINLLVLQAHSKIEQHPTDDLAVTDAEHLLDTSLGLFDVLEWMVQNESH